nr:hypothetical protein [Tanacetum cinerariifolium]
MNCWLEDDDDLNENVNNEDIKDADVKVEVDNEAELIFPYEMEGDQTPPPRDKSSDSEPETSHLILYNPILSRRTRRLIFHPRPLLGLLPKGQAELSTTQAEIALLKLKNKIRENATLKKKLAEKEMQLVIARMDHASTEQRLHESIRWNQRFYMEMVRKGAVPKPSSEDENIEPTAPSSSSSLEKSNVLTSSKAGMFRSN